MHGLTTTAWNVIAVRWESRYGSGWTPIQGANLDAIRTDAWAHNVIMMHRRRGETWELVARLTSPAWREIERKLAGLPFVKARRR